MSRLETYAATLTTWQRTINLVAPGTLPDLWHRHIADSAQLINLAPPTGRWVDLGSGGGLPGLVLAILLAERGCARMTLIESDQRKASFLRTVARACGVPVDILCERIGEGTTQAKLWPASVVTARALAPLPKLLGLASVFVSPATVCLFLKGRQVEGEIGEARKAWTFDVTLIDSRTDPEGRIARVSRLEAIREA